VRWGLATVFFIAIMGAAGYYVFNTAVAGGAYVVVPDITEMTITKASLELSEKGLEIGPQISMESEWLEGLVMTQLPEAGKVVRAGRKVYPTVSVGPRYVEAPNLVGQTREAAGDTIREKEFLEGHPAQIPYNLPVDTVIAQDPPAGRDIRRGDEISLLVSAGMGFRGGVMPDLTGKSLQEAMRLLGPLGVKYRSYHVHRPDAPFDVVLEQRPAAGTRLRRGQEVSFDIRSADTSEEVMHRKAFVDFIVPGSPTESHTVLMEKVAEDGDRSVIFPLRKRDYFGDAPPTYEGTTAIRGVPVDFKGEGTVEVYLDGEKVRAYYFQGNAEPTITDFRPGTPEGV
jgi:beta-lactam-binding protein with PASTA domain